MNVRPDQAGSCDRARPEAQRLGAADGGAAAGRRRRTRGAAPGAGGRRGECAARSATCICARGRARQCAQARAARHRERAPLCARGLRRPSCCRCATAWSSACAMAPAPMRSTLLAGQEATLKLLDRAFEKFSIKQLDPAGQRFDPSQHEAVLMQESAAAAAEHGAAGGAAGLRTQGPAAAAGAGDRGARPRATAGTWLSS